MPGGVVSWSPSASSGSDAWCLSLDVIGPARQGDDEVLKKVKYGLIGTLVVPDVLGKLFSQGT